MTTINKIAELIENTLEEYNFVLLPIGINGAVYISKYITRDTKIYCPIYFSINEIPLSLTINAVLPYKILENKQEEFSLFVNKLNYHLLIGNLEIHPQFEEVYIKTSTILSTDQESSKILIINSLRNCVKLIERFHEKIKTFS